MLKISRKKRVRDLPKLYKSKNNLCKQFQLNKMTKSSFSRKIHTSNDVIELVHINLCGPMRVESYYGDRYFIIFDDDYSRMMTSMFIKLKSHVFDMFKWYKDIVEKESGKQLKYLRSFRDDKFMFVKFTNFCTNNRNKRQISTLRTPQDNGIIEGRRMSISYCDRKLIIEKEVAKMLSRESISTTVFTLNQV